MDVKTCTKCGEEKELNNSNFIWKGKYYLGECRECNNAKRRISNNSEIGGELMTKLNDVEYGKLKSLLDNYNELMQVVNNKITLNTIDKSKRIKKSFNIEEGLYIILEKHAKINNTSISDILNAVVSKGIEFL